MYKKRCTIEDQCPWGVRPVIGMWSSKLNIFATDCILYTICPREKWSKKKWATKGNQ